MPRERLSVFFWRQTRDIPRISGPNLTPLEEGFDWCALWRFYIAHRRRCLQANHQNIKSLNLLRSGARRGGGCYPQEKQKAVERGNSYTRHSSSAEEAWHYTAFTKHSISLYTSLYCCSRVVLHKRSKCVAYRK